MRVSLIFRAAIISMSLITGSCLGVIDETKLKPLSSKPDMKEFIGKWEADSFSHKMIAERNVYKADSLSLIFYADSTFEAKNFPDFSEWTRVPEKGNIYDISGKWIVKHVKNRWFLDLSFHPANYLRIRTARLSHMTYILKIPVLYFCNL